MIVCRLDSTGVEDRAEAQQNPTVENDTFRVRTLGAYYTTVTRDSSQKILRV